MLLSHDRARRACGALVASLIVAVAVAALLPADASALGRVYVAKPAAGGRIVLDVGDGRLRRAAAKVPARCENNHGGSWTATLAIDLRGGVALRSGRFGIQGQSANKVRYQLGGRVRDGAISGRVRLTFLDLDFVGVDDSYLCDTGTRRYRAVRRR
jgi:hypothetical protein